MASRAAVTCVALGVLFGFSAPALAQKPAGSSGADVGVALRFGTLGIGAEVSKWLTRHVGARVGGSAFGMKFQGRNVKDINYDIKVKVHAASALLDLYPGARGAFHLSVGLLTKPAKVTLTGQPTGGSFEINNHTYTSSQVGTLTGTGEFPGVDPYVGLGFGTAARGGRIAFLVDLGTAIGKPKISLSATGASSNSQLQSDLDAQTATTQKDANKIPGYPVLTFGLMYRL